MRISDWSSDVCSSDLIKEMKLRPKIDPHDYETKKGHVVRFLKAGDKVKVTIMFRGREQSRPELGYRLLRRLESEIPDLGYAEAADRKSVVSGKSVAVRVDLVGRRIIKKKNHRT